MKKLASKRIDSIDVMRGLTIFLMLFVNDLYESGVPHWLVHAGAREDSLGLADLVFPAFLFMVGLSVPFAIESRRKKAATRWQILQHIVIRTVSLLTIGVFILNGTETINPALTGIPKLVWLFLLYVAVFLIWNNYALRANKTTGIGLNAATVLKGIGCALLLFLVWKFRGGTPERTTWLRHGWWGILGLIGWGYLAAALAYLYAGKKIVYGLLLWMLALLLNISSLSGWLEQLPGGWVRDFFGVWLNGNVPAITLAGLVVGMYLQRGVSDGFSFVKQLLLFGLLSLIIGFGLRHWFILSKIIGTPSWAMVCNGISMLSFAGLYFIIDLHGYSRWAYPFKIAGRNALTTYLAPDMIYYAVWYFGWSVFVYKAPINMVWVIGGSLLWAALMIIYAAALTKLHIKLKL